MSDAVAAVAAFELTSIEAFDTGLMTVKHPVTGEPTSWVWTIAGPGHPVTEAITKEVERETSAKRRAVEHAQVNRKKYKDDTDADENRRKVEERLARRILGWTPVTVDGQPLVHSQAAALDILTNPRWSAAAAQYLEYLGDEASFTKRSAKT